MRNKLKIIIPILIIIIIIAVISAIYVLNKNNENSDQNAAATTDIRGLIRAIDKDENKTTGSIYVEGAITPDSQYDRAVIRITEDTVIEKNGVKVTIEDINANDVVQVKFTGTIAESYPIQATASYINII